MISPDIGEVNLSGSIELTPTETTTYEIVISGAGGQIIRTMEITVLQQLSVVLRANITLGYAPMSVNFSPVMDSQNATNRHYWDFEGDGGAVDGGLGFGDQGFDRVVSLLTGRLRDYDVIGRDYSYTFSTPGIYTTRLRVWDANGLQKEANVVIDVSNRNPVVTTTADSDNGEVPLSVNFTASATDNEGVATFDWDYDGDGQYDESTSGTSSHGTYQATGQFTYANTGTYQARLRVTDTLGAETEISLPHINIRALPEGSATASISVSPNSGDAPLATVFSGVTSIPNGNPVTKWEWDFDGDGTIDTETSTGSVSHQFVSGGKYYPKLRVQTEDGQTAETVSEVVVNTIHQLSITENTIDPEAGASSTVMTTLGGDDPISIVVEDGTGNEVRSLVSWTDRVSGNYQDVWDGKDDQGGILPPGAYYAVLKYKVSGEDIVLDLRDTTGGDIFYPSTWGCARGISPCGVLVVPRTPLAPFNGQPWVFKYDSPHIAEMTSYMTVYRSNQVVNLFFQRQPVGVGNHEVVWNGEGTDGRMLPTVSTRYLISLFGHTLADNTMYLDHGVRISNMSVSPSIIYPTSADNVTGQITLDLSKNANLELSVIDVETGGEVLRRSLGQTTAGTALNFSWTPQNNQGVSLAPGPYRVSIQATDQYGYTSPPIHAMQRIQY
jgi:PKD repeat protein